MALTSTTPIYLSDIQAEFNASSLVGAANTAGFPTPVSMTDFLGASNVPSVYTIYDAGYESPVLSGFSPLNSTREDFRHQTGNGTWGSAPINTIQYQSNKIFIQAEPFSSMGYVKLAVGLDLDDWEYGLAADFRSQYSQIRVTYRTRRDSQFYTGIQYRAFGYWNSSQRAASSSINSFPSYIREVTTTSWSSTFVDTYSLGTGSTRYHYIGVQGYASVTYRRDIYAEIFKIEALA